MSYNAANIRTAIIEALDGTTSSIRAVTSATFAFGAFEGQPDSATRALATDRATATHRFDVELGPLTDHEATSPINLGNRRLARLSVSVPVWTKTATTVEETARRSLLASIRDDCDTAVQALGYPGNLRQTAAGGATNIASGMLTGLAWRLESAEWDRGIIRSRIEGECLVTIEYRTPDLVFGSLLEVWWDFDDASTITSSGGFLTSVTDKSGNGHTGAPDLASTISYFAAGGPSSRGYIQNDGTSINGVIASGGLSAFTFSEGDRPCVLIVGRADAYDANNNLAGVIDNIWEVSGVLTGTGVGFPASWFSFSHTGGGGGTADTIDSAVGGSAWHSAGFYMLSTGHMLALDSSQFFSAEAGGVSSQANGSNGFYACGSDTSASTIILLNDQPTTAQIDEYTTWALAEHGL